MRQSEAQRGFMAHSVSRKAVQASLGERLAARAIDIGIAYVPVTGFGDASDLLPTLIAGEIAAHVSDAAQTA